MVFYIEPNTNFFSLYKNKLSYKTVTIKQMETLSEKMELVNVVRQNSI